MVATKVTLLDVNGVRHSIDISLFQYSLRIYNNKGLPTNSWAVQFSDKTRLTVSQTQANYLHNLRDAYNAGTMRDMMTPRKKRNNKQ